MQKGYVESQNIFIFEVSWITDFKVNSPKLNKIYQIFLEDLPITSAQRYTNWILHAKKAVEVSIKESLNTIRIGTRDLKFEMQNYCLR